jgi:hypothetical protein
LLPRQRPGDHLAGYSVNTTRPGPFRMHLQKRQVETTSILDWTTNYEKQIFLRTTKFVSVRTELITNYQRGYYDRHVIVWSKTIIFWGKIKQMSTPNVGSGSCSLHERPAENIRMKTSNRSWYILSCYMIIFLQHVDVDKIKNDTRWVEIICTWFFCVL